MKMIDALLKTILANKINQKILTTDIPYRGDFTIDVKMTKGEVKDIAINVKEKELLSVSSH